MKIKILLFAAAAFLASSASAQDFRVDKDGIGPVTLSIKMRANGNNVDLNASARNDSAQPINYAKFCVRVDSRAAKKCDYQLWTTAVWNPGEEVTWQPLTAFAVGSAGSPVSISPGVTVVELKTVAPMSLVGWLKMTPQNQQVDYAHQLELNSKVQSIAWSDLEFRPQSELETQIIRIVVIEDSSKVVTGSGYHQIRRTHLEFTGKVRSAEGQIYTVTCSNQALGSDCGPLTEGDTFIAEVGKTTMWITARKGGKQGKETRIKYNIIDVH